MSRKRKWWLFGITLAVLTAAGAAAYQFSRRGPEGIAVETEPAEKRTIVQKVSATGRIQPSTQVNISADVSAKITKLGVREGDRVEKGDFLLELDSERYVALLESAQASLRVGQANAQVIQENLSKAEKDLVRTRELFAQELETQSALDSAAATYEADKARLRSATDQIGQARAALKQAQDDLSKTRIYAPISGTISRLNKEVGEIALGSQFQADVILELSNLAGMEALVDVDENDVVLLSVGDPAVIEVDALPGETLVGEVTEIANSAKVTGSGTADQKAEFEVKIAVRDTNSRLRPGMTATADVTTETREQVIGVPIQAVAVRTPEQLKTGTGSKDGKEAPVATAAAAPAEPAGTGWTPDRDGFVQVVFVVADGKARAKQVRTGIQSDSHIEILEGLEPGEQVVVGSYRAISKDLSDGAVVRIEKGTDGEGESAAATAERR